jgi:hypothetical protein
MGLVNLTTNLKSLRYGKDKVGGGSSNQPYIKTNIPDSLSDVGRTGGPDVILRGGALMPGRAIKDVSRLAQMFFDFKSIGGPLFIAKENILSRTSVATDGQGKALNNGIYLPTSTLLQSAGNSLGLHLNKQGIDPFKGIGKNGGGIFELFGGTDPLGQPTYVEITTNPQYESKLKDLTNTKIDQKTDSPELLNYQGGPGSILGIGKTRIPLSKQRTGLNNPGLNYTKGSVTWAGGIDPKPVDTYFPSTFDLSPPSPPPFSGNNFTNQLNVDLINSGQYNTKYIPSKYTGRNLFPDDVQYSNLTTNDQFKRVGASSKYLEFFGNKSTSSPKPDHFSSFLNKSLGSNTRALQNSFDLANFNNNPVTQATDNIKDAFLGNGKLKDPDSYNISEEILKKESSKNNPTIEEKFNTLNFSLDYKKHNIENRVGLGNPGKRGIVTNYQNGKTDLNGVKLGPLDKITSMPLYKSSNVTSNPDKNDLVKFRIGVIDNNDPSLKTYIHFRAFLDSMSDGYNAEWAGEKLMGRGESFYRYNGFDRSVSLAWTVVAQSREELMPMYRKLNYLASSLAPDYSATTGYMRGNLVTLTVGGYLYEQPGIITSLNYNIPEESPWEIAIPSSENQKDPDNPIISDKSVKEMPHMIKVTGFNFIPIHEFTPKIQQNTYDTNGELTSYSQERYIALKNGINDNYN